MRDWISDMSQLTSLHQENEYMEQAEDMICEFAYEKASKSLKTLSKPPPSTTPTATASTLGITTSLPSTTYSNTNFSPMSSLIGSPPSTDISPATTAAAMQYASGLSVNTNCTTLSATTSTSTSASSSSSATTTRTTRTPTTPSRGQQRYLYDSDEDGSTVVDDGSSSESEIPPNIIAAIEKLGPLTAMGVSPRSTSFSRTE
jgi:hypothetical protein